MTQEADQLGVATIVNGLPTCTFAPRMYARKVTNVVVTNGVASIVNCYRGSLSSTPVATSLLGARNTIMGQITIPAGQQFFVQWSAVGTPVSSATARVSFSTADPLDGGGSDYQSWTDTLITSLTIPSNAGPNDPAIVEGDVTVAPAELIAYYAIAPAEIIVAIKISRLNATQYGYEALVVFLPDYAIVTGVVNGSDVVELTREYMVATVGLFEFGTSATHSIVRIKRNADLDVELGATMFYDGVSLPQGEAGTSYGIAGTLVTCIGPEIAMPSYGVGGLSTTFTFQPGRIYQIEVSFMLTYTAGGTYSMVRLRKGLNSLVGQQLGRRGDDFNGTNFGLGNTKNVKFYVKNATVAAISTSLGLTVERLGGAGNIGLFGDSFSPLTVRTTDITNTAGSLAGIAVAIV